MIRARLVDDRVDSIGVRLPTFVTLDAAAEIYVWDEIALQFWAQNLLDAEYQDTLGIPGARRSFFIAVNYRTQAKKDQPPPESEGETIRP
jgi:outer membrane cobalamin receptor